MVELNKLKSDHALCPTSSLERSKALTDVKYIVFLKSESVKMPFPLEAPDTVMVNPVNQAGKAPIIIGLFGMLVRSRPIVAVAVAVLPNEAPLQTAV
jgi:hypothetical protein